MNIYKVYERCMYIIFVINLFLIINDGTVQRSIIIAGSAIASSIFSVASAIYESQDEDNYS